MVPDRMTRTTERPDGTADASGASADPSGRSGDAGVSPEMALEEELLVVLRGIGASMFLTTQRVIVARDGVERRPRTGIQSFPVEAIRHVRLEIGTAPSGRIVVWTATDQEAASMFFDARSLNRAQRFIDIARPLIARQRRRGPGARPARPPSGPAGSGTSDPA